MTYVWSMGVFFKLRHIFPGKQFPRERQAWMVLRKPLSSSSSHLYKYSLLKFIYLRAHLQSSCCISSLFWPAPPHHLLLTVSHLESWYGIFEPMCKKAHVNQTKTPKETIAWEIFFIIKLLYNNYETQ